MYDLFVAHVGFGWERNWGELDLSQKTRVVAQPVGSVVDTFAGVGLFPNMKAPTRSLRDRHPDMHRQSMASRSQFGQSSAQAASTQALRNKKKEYEAISALEQSCAELIATLEDMAADLNTTAEATIGAIHTLRSSATKAEMVSCMLGSYRKGDGTLDGNVSDSWYKSYVEIRGSLS